MPLHDPSSAKPCRRARTHSSCFSSPIWSVGGGQPRTRRSGIFRSSRQSMTSWWPDPVVVPSTSTIDAMPHTSSHDCPSRPMRQHWLSTMTPPWHAGSSILQFSEGPSSPSSPPSSNSSRNCATDRSGASSASARSAPVRASVIRRGHQRPPTGWVSRSKAKMVAKVDRHWVQQPTRAVGKRLVPVGVSRDYPTRRSPLANPTSAMERATLQEMLASADAAEAVLAADAAPNDGSLQSSLHDLAAEPWAITALQNSIIAAHEAAGLPSSSDAASTSVATTVTKAAELPSAATRFQTNVNTLNQLCSSSEWHQMARDAFASAMRQTGVKAWETRLGKLGDYPIVVHNINGINTLPPPGTSEWPATHTFGLPTNLTAAPPCEGTLLGMASPHGVSLLSVGSTFLGYVALSVYVELDEEESEGRTTYSFKPFWTDGCSGDEDHESAHPVVGAGLQMSWRHCVKVAFYMMFAASTKAWDECFLACRHGGDQLALKLYFLFNGQEYEGRIGPTYAGLSGNYGKVTNLPDLLRHILHTARPPLPDVSLRMSRETCTGNRRALTLKAMKDDWSQATAQLYICVQEIGAHELLPVPAPPARDRFRHQRKFLLEEPVAKMAIVIVGRSGNPDARLASYNRVTIANGLPSFELRWTHAVQKHEAPFFEGRLMAMLPELGCFERRALYGMPGDRTTTVSGAKDECYWTQARFHAQECLRWLVVGSSERSKFEQGLFDRSIAPTDIECGLGF